MQSKEGVTLSIVSRVTKNPTKFKKEAYRDGLKRKGEIGMEYDASYHV